MSLVADCRACGEGIELAIDYAFCPNCGADTVRISVRAEPAGAGHRSAATGALEVYEDDLPAGEGAMFAFRILVDPDGSSLPVEVRVDEHCGG